MATGELAESIRDERLDDGQRCSICADQAPIPATLTAGADEQVAQLSAALTTIHRQHSQGYRHDDAPRRHRPDVGPSGLPCGRRVARAAKGAFANQRHRRGRRLGRVLATRDSELVADQVAPGTSPLVPAPRSLVEAAERVLDDPARRRGRRAGGRAGQCDPPRW